MLKQLAFIVLGMLGVVNPVSAQSLFGDSRNPFPPDRNYDVKHYKITVEPDFYGRSMKGKTTISATMLATGDTSTWFHAAGLQFSSIRYNGQSVRFRTGNETIHLTLPEPTKRNRTDTFDFEYTVSYPQKGLYFRVPGPLTPYRRLQAWTQGEDMDNRFWFPCYDFPNDKATSEMIITIPDTLEALSNGRLLKITPDKKNRKSTWHYRQELPHSSYLIMLAIGDYEIVRSKSAKIPLEYWIYPDKIADGKRGFQNTGAMLKVFEDFTGVPYPWEKYAQVVIQDFMYGGMENTGATTMNDDNINYDRSDRQDRSSDGLVAHEAAHQWFGNIVTMRDWTHLWLNESFATYLETLYYERTGQQALFESDILNNQSAGIRVDRWKGRKPVVSVDSYPDNLYPRGASILHMLRYVLGDDGFITSIRLYLKNNAYKNATTQDLIHAIEESTGKNMQWFFDQWIFKAGYPEYEISHEYDSLKLQLKIRIVQTQDFDSLTGVFRMPLSIDLDTPTGVIKKTVENRSADTSFYFSDIRQLKNFSVDRENYILKTKSYDKPFHFWLYQLETGKTMASLQEAMDAVVDSIHHPVVSRQFLEIMKSSPFPDLRDRAADFLFGSPDSHLSVQTAGEALENSVSMVRRTAVTYLTNLPDKREAWTLALKQYETDSSAMVLRATINALFKLDSTRALTYFKKELKTKPVILQTWPTLLTNFGRYGKSPVDLTFLDEYTRSTISRDIREAALYAMKELDPKHPLTKKRWLEVITTDEDEILRGYLINDVEDFRSEETAEVLRKILHSDPWKFLQDQARLKLVLMGMPLNK